jgi:hypothetical protein
LGTQLVVFAVLPHVSTHFSAVYVLLLVAKTCYGAGMTLINLLAGEVFGPVNAIQTYSLLIFGFVAAAVVRGAKYLCWYSSTCALCSFNILQVGPTAASSPHIDFATYCYICCGVLGAGLIVLLNALFVLSPAKRGSSSAGAPLLPDACDGTEPEAR